MSITKLFGLVVLAAILYAAVFNALAFLTDAKGVGVFALWAVSTYWLYRMWINLKDWYIESNRKPADCC